MNGRIIRWTLTTTTVLIVMLGCTGVLQHVADEASMGTGGESIDGGFARVDSDFSDAPVSPGGTGGIGNPMMDEQPTDLEGEVTRSFFTAFQIDPVSEDSAGPKFIVAEDVDRDGLLDLLTGWKQSQPVQLHLQRRDAEGNISFRSVTLAGTSPIAIMAGVEFGYINDDEWLDVVVLSKATGAVTLCPTVPPSVVGALEIEVIVLFSPGNAGQIPDGDAWTQMILVNPFVRCRRGTSGEFWVHNQFPGFDPDDYPLVKAKPEHGSATSLAVGNVDGVAGDDIVVALNFAECEELGQEPPTNVVDLWVNPGPGLSEIPNMWGAPFFTDDPAVATTCPGFHEAHPPDAAPIAYSDFLRIPVSIMLDAPEIRDIQLDDVDGDGDLDIVAAWSNSLSRNLRWARNPLVPHQTGGPGGLAEVINGFTDGWRFWATGWQQRPVGQIDSGADSIALGDMDSDGFTDVLVRSSAGVVQWFRKPNSLVVQPEFPPNDPVPDRFNFPWPVFTLTEFDQQEPDGIAVGDLTADGQVELVVAAEGAAFWYDGTVGPSVFDAWSPNTIIQDGPTPTQGSTAGGTTVMPAPGSGVGVSAVDVTTQINTLLIVDIDGDGRNDIIGTLDRRSGSGLSDDRLVWYRNIRTEEAPAP